MATKNYFCSKCGRTTTTPSNPGCGSTCPKGGTHSWSLGRFIQNLFGF